MNEMGFTRNNGLLPEKKKKKLKHIKFFLKTCGTFKTNVYTSEIKCRTLMVIFFPKDMKLLSKDSYSIETE